jgi:transposase-like protein
VNTTRRTDSVEVILKDQRRRRWAPAEKAALVRRTYEPGMSVSLVARQEGVRPACCSSGGSWIVKAR